MLSLVVHQCMLHYLAFDSKSLDIEIITLNDILWIKLQNYVRENAAIIFFFLSLDAPPVLSI